MNDTNSNLDPNLVLKAVKRDLPYYPCWFMKETLAKVLPHRGHTHVFKQS